MSSRLNSATSKHSSQRSVRVIMLDKQEIIIKIENKGARVAEVFSQVCQLIDLKETDYFGLAILQDNEFHFVLNDTKLQKIAPKVWKSKDCSVDEPLLTFYFRVQYYVDNIGLLKEKVTRLQYYLQLRDNLLHFNQSVSEEKCFLLAGLALQADFGNFDHERHVGAYFDPREFFPAWVMIRRGQDYITNHLPSIHRDMAGMSAPDARVQYIRDLSEPPAAHNMHFYRLRRRKYDPAPGNDWLAICPKSLEVYEESMDSFKNLLSVFLWSNIGKLSCEKKKFEIVAEGLAERRFVYYASTKESGEQLLDMCRASHRFQLSRQAQLSELKRLEEHDRWGVRHHEKYVYSENADFSSLRHVPQAAGCQELLKPAVGGSDRRIQSGLRRSKNSIRAVSSPPSSSTPVAGSEETKFKEIMIDTPPQIPPSSFSLTKVTPIVDHSTVWTSPSCDVSSGIENMMLSSSVQERESQLHRIQQQQQQPASVSLLFYSTPQPPGLLAPAIGRGSIVRSSASSTEDSLVVTSGSVSCVPQSILKQPAVSLHCDVAANSSVHTTVAAITPGAQGSLSTGSTSISAKSLQRTMPPGADFNDMITKMLAGKSSVATALQNVTPQRKSSLVCARSGPSPSADVARSTSLRQPAKSDAEEFLPLRHCFASTQLNVSTVPLPVEAHFQRIPFATPMTVTSSPVHIAPGVTGPSSGGMTPPTYHPPPTYKRATNFEQPSFLTPPQSNPQRSNHCGTASSGRPQHDLMRPSFSAQNHIIGGDRRPYFDLLASEASANSSIQLDSATNSVYRLVPFTLADTVELVSAQVQESQTVSMAAGKPAAPPSYQMAKSQKMSAVNSTPPSSKRYFEDIEANQQARFAAQLAEQSNSITASTAATSVDFTNGDVSVHRSYMATPVRLTNGRHEPVANGPTSYVSAPHTKPLGVAVTRSPSSSVNRHLHPHPPVRQLSSTSTESNDVTSVPLVQCLKHGSGVHIVDQIKDNIGALPAPMLMALCNDPSLRSSCTCSHPGDMVQWTPPTHSTLNCSTTRRLSLSQPPHDQPGTVARPYSWASEHGSVQLLNLQQAGVDVDSLSGPSRGELVNGGQPVHSSYAFVHRHSDGDTYQTAY